MKRRFWIEFKNWEPVFVYYTRDSNGNTTTTKRGMFFWFRKIQSDIENNRVKKFLISQGHEPIKCEGCGEGWAQYIIEDPNEPFGTKKKWKVCHHCVHFYDIKWTNQKLYKDIIDFRG